MTSPTPQWSDMPLNATDISGRSHFATTVARRIRSTSLGDDSTVYGLVAPWGGGKTTLLHDVTGRIADQFVVVWFSPWSAADVTSIGQEFIAALSEAFPTAAKYKKALQKYGRFGTPALRIIPVAGSASSEVAERILDEIGASSSWHSQFQKVSKQIEKRRKQVLVVVDDVDRLDAEELRALLRVIRLLGRFKNVHYLLAYDQATLDRLLAVSGTDGRSSDFMEKIVQYPFEIPPVPAINRRRWAREIVSVMLTTEMQLSESLRGPTEQLVEVLADGVETPRAAERLREQLLVLSGLARNAELDSLDFIAISWLRIAHHDVWEFVRNNRSTLGDWYQVDTKEKKSHRERKLSELVKRGSVKAVEQVLGFLFSNMKGYNSLGDRKRRMYQSRYFDRYFLLEIADDDVSDALVRDAINAIDEGKSTPSVAKFSELICGEDGERAALAIQIAQESRTAPPNNLNLLNYLHTKQSTMASSGALADFRQGPFERWLAKETTEALVSGALKSDEAISQFGYEPLARFAFYFRRIGSQTDEYLNKGFRQIAEIWAMEFKNEELNKNLERPELYAMISLCNRIGGAPGQEILGEKITNVDELILIAQRFVRWEEWIGFETEYSVSFDGKTFIYAVGEKALLQFKEGLPTQDETLDYQPSDRAQPDLSPEELRDFALGQVYEVASLLPDNTEPKMPS